MSRTPPLLLILTLPSAIFIPRQNRKLDLWQAVGATKTTVECSSAYSLSIKYFEIQFLKLDASIKLNFV